MTKRPWDESISFHSWLSQQIAIVLADGPPQIRASGRNRPLYEDDFGFSSKTLDNWSKKPPTDPFPDGRKMCDLINSVGFPHLNHEHQHALIKQWIEIELNGQSHDLTDELVGLLMKMVENSQPNFIAECLSESRS